MNTLRLAFGLLPLLANAAVLERAKSCTADDCARAVTGTSANVKPAIATRSADCSSFQAVIATPVTYTTFTTYTSTETDSFTSTETDTFYTTVYGAQYAAKRQVALSTTTIFNTPTRVPTYASACAGSVRYSSACNCLGITRTTSTLATSTSTITVSAVTTISTTTIATISTTSTSYAPIPTLCGNAGTQWALWPDASQAYTNTQYDSYDPTQHKAQTPDATGVTPYVKLDRQSLDLYGYSLSAYAQGSNPINLAVTQRGYIFAAESGAYTFQTANEIDDYLFVWIGAAAYSGWTRSNALIAVNVNTPQSYYTRTATLVAGQYYPFRIFFKQYQGPASLHMTVTAPSGQVIFSPTTQDSPLLVQYSCDGTTAPPYQPFGQET